MSKEENLDHVHGASANEASILIDAHEAIESGERLSYDDEKLLVSLLDNFRNKYFVYEYMDKFYGDSPWPAIEDGLSEIFMLNNISTSSLNRKIHFYSILKPYLKKVANLDWLLDYLVKATKDTGVNYLSAIPKFAQLNPFNGDKAYNSFTDLFAPYVDRALEEVTQIFESKDRSLLTRHLWDTFFAKRSRGQSGATALLDWALAAKLYYFKLDDPFNTSCKNMGSFINFCNPVIHDQQEWTKLFSMFDFEDFLEDTELIIPYCKNVLKGRFYDIEEFLKEMDPSLYKRYVEMAPRF